MRRAEVHLHQVEQTASGRRFFFRLAAGVESTEVVITVPCDPGDTDCDTAFLAAQLKLTSILHDTVLANRRVEMASVLLSSPSHLLH